MKPNNPNNPSQTTSPPLTRGPRSFLAIGVAILVFIVAYSFFGPARRSAPTAPPPPIVDAQALEDELAELGDLFGAVMDNNRDAQPLIDRIDALIAKHPEISVAHTLRGQVLMYAGQLDPAIEALERSLEIEPRQADIHRLTGTAAMQLDRLEVALHHYEQALSIEPDDSGNALFLANVQHKLGNSNDAVVILLAAIRRDSELHGAYALLSDIYAEQNKINLALDQIDRAIEATPAERPNTIATYTLKCAALLRRDNMPAESLAVLDALPIESRLRPDVLRDTATSWAMLDKPEMAAEVYERALVIDPSNDHAAAEAARWWIKAGDTDAAGRNHKALLRINPRHPAIPELDAAITGN